MNYTSSYFIEDVEKFLLINKELENSQQSKSLKKLLSVQHKISMSHLQIQTIANS